MHKLTKKEFTGILTRIKTSNEVSDSKTLAKLEKFFSTGKDTSFSDDTMNDIFTIILLSGKNRDILIKRFQDFFPFKTVLAYEQYLAPTGRNKWDKTRKDELSSLRRTIDSAVDDQAAALQIAVSKKLAEKYYKGLTAGTCTISEGIFHTVPSSHFNSSSSSSSASASGTSYFFSEKRETKESAPTIASGKTEVEAYFKIAYSIDTSVYEHNGWLSGFRSGKGNLKQAIRDIISDTFGNPKNYLIIEEERFLNENGLKALQEAVCESQNPTLKKHAETFCKLLPQTVTGQVTSKQVVDEEEYEEITVGRESF